MGAAIENQALGSVLVIEDDDSVGASFKRLLEGSTSRLDLCRDGKEAWQFVTSHKYDLILLDWKLPTVSGLALLNRIRRHQHYAHRPVIIVSGYLTKHDHNLMEEFPLTGIVKKPFNNQMFLQEIKCLVKQSAALDSERVLIDQLEKMLNGDGPKSLAMCRAIITKIPSHLVPMSVYAAKKLRLLKMPIEAETLLRDALQKRPDCLPLLTELGKILIMQKQYVDALRVLMEAQARSPDNIERLCLMGEANLNLMNIDDAKENFEEAEHIDKGDRKVKAGLLLTGNLQSYMSSIPGDELPGNFAGLLNAIGISMVHAKKFGEGMEHYKAAMNYVTDENIQARLAFNLGLGHVRWNKLEEALPWFRKSLELSDGTFEKSRHHADRLTTQLGLTKLPMIGKEGVATLTLKASREQTSLNAGFSSDILHLEEFTEEETVIAELNPDSSPALPESGSFDAIDGSQKAKVEMPWKSTAQEKTGDVPIVNGVPLSEIDPYDLFVRQIPMGQQLIQLLEEHGYHVNANLSRAKKLLETYSFEELKSAVKEAVDRGTPEASAISFLLANSSPGRKAG